MSRNYLLNFNAPTKILQVFSSTISEKEYKSLPLSIKNHYSLYIPEEDDLEDDFVQDIDFDYLEDIED